MTILESIWETITNTILRTQDFPPRWRCGKWYDWHGWLHVLSDTAIWAAYMAIPIVLLYFIRKRDDVSFHNIFYLFAAFIFLCGFGHLIEATIFWYPVYYFAGTVKMFTAIVSWATVLVLVQIVPKILELPSLVEKNAQLTRLTQDLNRSNQDLQDYAYAAAHGLKGPLRGIHNYASIIHEDEDQSLSSTGKRKLSAISTLTQHLDERLNLLLQLSSIRNRTAHRNLVDLRQVFKKLRNTPSSNSNTPIWQLSSALPCVESDERQLIDALGYIISFAYARERTDSPLTLKVSSNHASQIKESMPHNLKEDNKWRISLEFNGIPMSAKEADLVLDPLVWSSEKSINFENAGLFYAKKILENLNESLWIEQSSEGSTRICITLDGSSDEPAE